MFEHVRYALADGGHVAYRVANNGEKRHLIMVSGTFFPVDALLEDRVSRRFIDGLASLGCLVVFDKRGIGLSDPILDWSRFPADQWADDLAAVIRAADLNRPTVVSWDPFGSARRAAAAYPELIGRLVLVNPVPSLRQFAKRVEIVTSKGDVSTTTIERAAFPSRIDDPAFREWLQRAGRLGASPAVAKRLWELTLVHEESVTPEGIRCPTLVLHRVDCMANFRQVREVVDAIEGAEFVQVEGVDVYPIAGDVDSLIAEIARFLTGTAVAPLPERAVAAVLFTDLVASTGHAAGVGDEAWRDLLDGHDRVVRNCVERAGGEVVKFTGDGALVLLPSARAAIVTSQAIRTRLLALGLQIRAGVHVGDVDRRGDDVSGIAVNVAARVMHETAPGEILVSESARRATLGASSTFGPPRTLELKGVPELWVVHPLVTTGPA